MDAATSFAPTFATILTDLDLSRIVKSERVQLTDWLR